MNKHLTFYTVTATVLNLILLAMVCGHAFGEQIDKGKAVDTLIGEAESGGQEAMLWCACTIRNRGSLKGCYGWKSERVKKHLYSSYTFVQAVKAWEVSAKFDVTGGCKFWFSDADLRMAKVKSIIRKEKLIFVKRVGGNSFYKRGIR